jgi:hypothetical protein
LAEAVPGEGGDGDGDDGGGARGGAVVVEEGGGKTSKVRAKPEEGFDGNESVRRREVSVARTVVGGSFS